MKNNINNKWTLDNIKNKIKILENNLKSMTFVVSF